MKEPPDLPVTTQVPQDSGAEFAPLVCRSCGYRAAVESAFASKLVVCPACRARVYTGKPGEAFPTIHRAKPGRARQVEPAEKIARMAGPDERQQDTPRLRSTGDELKRAQTSKLAVWGFVLSLASPLSCGLLTPVAFLMSMVAMMQIRGDSGFRGMGFAMAGMVISVLGAVGFGLFLVSSMLMRF